MTSNSADEMAASPQAPTSASNRDHLKQKRARSQLSCTPCRQGKLKCNRAHDPACDQCIKRNRESSCLFPPAPTKHSKPPQNVKGRIRQLEELVVNLMNQNKGPKSGEEEENQTPSEEGGASTGRDTKRASVGTFSHPTPPSDSDGSPQVVERRAPSGTTSPNEVDTTTPLFGQMKISKNEISYVGEAHWDAILNSISDLKRDLGDDDGEADDQHEGDRSQESPDLTNDAWMGTHPGMAEPMGVSGMGFMLGSPQHVTKEQLVSSVPEKKVADRLLSLWFNSPDPFKPIIHGPTFQEEYRRFWRNPDETPVMWLGLLYSILSLAASFGLRDNDPSSPLSRKVREEVNRYHTLAASAAVLGDFTKPKPYTIECLILYGAGLRSNNAFVNIWLMIGLVVRLALRMGYHRDPNHYPNISPFYGEMRRRIWAGISMIDVLISFQLGLPSMVRTIQNDTLPPRNILDRDFNPSTKVLPQDRSLEELTPSSYTRAKLQTVRVFADAAELSHATVPPAYEDMMALDKQLEQARADVPPMLQMPDISEVVTDPAEQLMCRFNLALLYRKTKIVLHRRYMLTPHSELSPREQQRGVGDSRMICVQSALQVLEYHQTIYAASQPGGQLESVKWYMGSISTHDFLLAAMVLCLELNSQISYDQTLVNGFSCPHRGAMMEALEKSQKIWSDASNARYSKRNYLNDRHKADDIFDETDKAARAMSVMLKRVKQQFGSQSHSTSGSCGLTPASGTSNEQSVGRNMTPASSSPKTTASTGTTSDYQWGSMSGLPGGMDVGNTQLSNIGMLGNQMQGDSFGYTSSGNSNQGEPVNNGTFTPTGDGNGGQMDFSMIGNMLDVSSDLDWQMWDHQFTTGPQTQMNDWSPQIDSNMANNPRFFGNTLVGGSGVVASSSSPQPPLRQSQGQYPPMVAGNAITVGGTGPIPASQTIHGLNSPAIDFSNDSFGFAANNDAYENMDFTGMDADTLQDVHFDFGPMKYNPPRTG